MFKKSMIAMAVLAMATGVQAKTVQGDTANGDLTFNNKAEDFVVVGGHIGKTDIDITAQNITVTNPKEETTDKKHGIYAQGPVKLTAVKDITINSNYLGVYLAGHETTDHQKPAKLEVTAGGTITVNTKSGWAVKNEKANGQNAGITLNAPTVVINGANGITNNGSGTDIAIKAETIKVDVKGKAVAENFSDIKLDGKKAIVITSSDTSGNGYALQTYKGNLTFSETADISITGDIVYSKYSPKYEAGNGSITLNSSGTTVINGNIKAEEGSTITANLTGANSVFNGKVETITAEGGTSKPTTNIGLKDGATWNAKAESHVTNLTLAGGVVDLKGQKVAVDTLAKDSTGTIRMDVGADGKKEVGSFTVATANNAKLTADLVQNADVVTSDIAKNALDKITTSDKDGKLTVTADVKEGLVNPGTVYGQDGKVLSTTGNSLMRDTLQLAQTSSLSLNRILMNDVRKRMGDLRAAEGKHGAWARYDGGRLSGEGGFENDFHTIQVGVDAMPLDNGVRFGLAGSYTKGDAEYARGDADMDAFGLAAYATWMGDNGMFVDGVARMAKASNDLTVDRDMKGKLDSLAVSLSGEFGWRFPIAANAYVEPQFEATYTYIDGEKMTLSNGKQEANYELGSFDSFLTRAGVLAGYTFPNNKGDVYVRASAVHEFLGDSEISGKTGKANHMERIDGKDTWVELGLGGNYSVTPNTYVWADVERTTGASIETDYRATVGVRYAF